MQPAMENETREHDEQEPAPDAEQAKDAHRGPTTSPRGNADVAQDEVDRGVERWHQASGSH
jgi:hypothetical protein